MLVKPNEQYSRNGNDMENDLYRKFNAIFTEILHPDDSSYDIDAYCKTKNSIEEKVINVMNNFSDSIVPILGYTGMGKTYLMHYCIRKKYNVHGLIKNMSFIASDGINKSLVIYASYDAHKMDKVADGRLAGKLAAASSEILKEMKINNETREGKLAISKSVAEYIRQNKAELLEENAPSTDALDIEKAENLYKMNQLAYEQEKLKWLLTHKAKDIKDVIVILDDIEGLVNVKKKNLIEYELIDTYLKMYDCLRRCENEDRKYKVKLFLCMRERTYNEVKKSAWYNTHRVNNDPFFLTSGIRLGEIFMKRFSSLESKTGILEEIKKKNTWEEAKSVLRRLSDELEHILGNGILEICNYNVCDAVQLFASILGNRQWTQKSEKAQASFKIEEYQYYLSTASCYRAIAMKNEIIYTNEYHLTNIFYDNDKIGYCLPIYILMMMNEVGGNNKELSLKQIQDNMIDAIRCKSDVERQKREQVEEIVKYFTEREIFFEKIIIISETEVDCKYYISPKGKTILKNFFDNTIFLEIYRDDIFLDGIKHNISYSTNLAREELFMETIKIIDEIGKEEIEYMRTFENMGTLETYYRLWRNERISIRLIEAQKKSLEKYYKQNVPDKLIRSLNDIEMKYRKALDDSILRFNKR